VPQGGLIDPRSIANTLQAFETAANQRLHDRMGRQQDADIVFGEMRCNETTLQGPFLRFPSTITASGR
jgi:hypothetical protein